MKSNKIGYSLVPVYVLILGAFLLISIGGSRAITAVSEDVPRCDRRCIIVDAGHGGIDGGAVSCTGVYESQINLEIALRLEPLLNLLGIDTVMIRKSDISIYTQGETIAAKKLSDLKERVRIANSRSDAVIVSIHQNHFSDSRYSGAQVFYAQTQGSQGLAQSLQSSLVKHLNIGSNRKAKRAEGVYLMQNISTTGILVECGFLSNHSEEAMLRTKAYQQKLICVIASVCSGYLHGSQ